MSDKLIDTTAEARTAQIEALKRLGPKRRSELAAQWSEEMRQIALNGIRDRHPEFTERRVVLEYARITLGETLFREAFGEEALGIE